MRARALAVALAAATALTLAAAPAPAATGKVTQEDCDAGHVLDRDGKAIVGERCERLVGRRVELARTGFDAWPFAIGGAACIALAVALRPRRRAAREA
ncbi:MAG TPA: hypothetical protein VF520_09730 [Thermoleophilaceae bacterium]